MNNQPKHHRPQDDIPYEQLMKHIIEDYHRLQRQLDYIVPYTKKLEAKIEYLKDENARKGLTNKTNKERLVAKNREMKQWRDYALALYQAARLNNPLPTPPPFLQPCLPSADHD